MDARMPYSADAFPSYESSEFDAGFEAQGFYAGEPVCPQPSRRLEIVPYTYLFLLLAFTVASAFAADDDTRREWIAKGQRVAALLATPQQPASAAAPLPTKEIASADTPGSIPVPPPAPPAPPPTPAAQPLPEVTVANAPGDQADEIKSNTPEKPRVFDAYTPPRTSNDPYRRKAEAVGLNPDLSRVVLSRLTSVDYRNAAYAIEKALRTVPNDGEFTWPRARKAGAAIFNVHFVPGAGRDCRRYVVTITKNRWTSTALPMEKCGVKIAVRNPAAEKAIE